MLIYIIKRLSFSLLLVWGILTLTFLIIHLAPGDPASLYVRPEIKSQTVENIRRQMGLDLPVWQQYFRWQREFCTGNFGISLTHQRPVSQVLAEAIPNTLQLTCVVFLLHWLLSVVLGVLMAAKRHTRLDTLLGSGLLFLYSMPGFWLALMAILVFSLKLGWLPSSQMQSITAMEGFGATVVDRIRHLILPAMVLAAPLTAYGARLIRNNLIEVLSQDYIRTAWAYGLNRGRILYIYGLKNALLPIATLSGLYLPFLLGGAVITEYIFSWPGMGRITVDAIFAHDFPVILASNFIAALTVVVGNFISDLLYVVIDPRIRIQAQV